VKSYSPSQALAQVQYGPYRKVPTARWLVTSSMTSRDTMSSNSWRHNLQNRRIRKLWSTIREESLSKH